MKREYIGDYGEMCAARYLRGRGVRLIASRYRTRFGEIDLILQDGEFLAFAEVKTRSSGMMAAPMESVDGEKRRKLILTADAYLSAKQIAPPCRFDVLEVYLDGGGQVRRINWIKDAFDAEIPMNI